MPPTVCFVTGFWLGPKPYMRVASLLHSQGLPTEIITLPSTGSISPNNPTMDDDIAFIRSKVADMMVDWKEVVLVLHSGAGFLGSNAIEGMTLPARKERDLRGGVSKIVFVTGAVFPEGFKHKLLPIYKIDGGAMHCLEPEKLFYNDLPPDDAKTWIDELKTQPATEWDSTVTYCGWREVPSVYLVCENDQTIPPSMQLQCAELAGSQIERCDGGHVAMVSMPEKVAEVIKMAAESAN
ncbi:hypothetical protein ACLMJK_001997 [Lecanora helva]